MLMFIIDMFYNTSELWANRDLYLPEDEFRSKLKDDYRV